MDRSKQLILCVEAEALSARGIKSAEGMVLVDSSWLDSTPCWFVPRSLAEEDPKFRQLIPYIVLADPAGRIAVYRRGTAGGEARLHDRLAIGFGGHVDLKDALLLGANEEFDAKMTLKIGAQREISEELLTQLTVKNVTDIGLIMSDADDVSRVHLGFVQVWTIDSSIEAGESCILEIEWHTLSQLSAMKHRMENWSRIVCDALTPTAVT